MFNEEKVRELVEAYFNEHERLGALDKNVDCSTCPMHAECLGFDSCCEDKLEGWLRKN